MSETSVLIAETDSPWLPWAQAWRKPEHELVLLVQDRNESQRSFFERVSSRFAHLTREGRTLDRVVLVAGSRWDASSLLARAEAVRKLLVRFEQLGQGTQLVLDEGPKHGLAARGMKAIATSIADLAAGASSRLQVEALSQPSALAA